MPAPRSSSDLVAASRLYYLDGLSQSEVAQRLGLSRSSVSRILAAARERGIVEIRINPEGSLTRRDDLERRLVDRFGLADAVVVTRPLGRQPVDVVAEIAARVFETRLASLTRVGMSWGNTIARIVEHVLIEPIYPQLHFYPLAGGMPSDTGPAGNDSIEYLARQAGAHVHRFEAPAVVESRLTWQALVGESYIKRAVAMAAEVQAAVVGIGSIGVHASPRVVSAMHLDDAEAEAFWAQQPAGDICGQFYDIDGGVLGPPSSERSIGISLDQLRQVPRVVGVASGVEKAPGTLGAVRTGVLKSLIVDDELAEAILSEPLPRRPADPASTAPGEDSPA